MFCLHQLIATESEHQLTGSRAANGEEFNVPLREQPPMLLAIIIDNA
jgi:hypothetical protein